MISASPLLQQQYRLFQNERKFRFYLGAPNAAWLYRHPGIPLFVSRRQMPKARFRPAVVDWALDSGGFTELQKFGRWTIDAHEYSVLVNRYRYNVGRLCWAAQQDWMCEPIVIHGGKGFAGTGLSVAEHQRRTVDNFLELEDYCHVPVIPVIQGYTIDEYHECIDLYSKNGVDLTEYDTVGVGSICRRQATKEAVQILRSINRRGINIHGFGLKREALRNALAFLASADSMAWSFNARHSHGKKSCGKINQRTGKPIKNCANCYHAAAEWHEKTMEIIDGETTSGDRLPRRHQASPSRS